MAVGEDLAEVQGRFGDVTEFGVQREARGKAWLERSLIGNSRQCEEYGIVLAKWYAWEVGKRYQGPDLRILACSHFVKFNWRKGKACTETKLPFNPDCYDPYGDFNAASYSRMGLFTLTAAFWKNDNKAFFFPGWIHKKNLWDGKS